jgi:hypothetical protein
MRFFQPLLIAGFVALLVECKSTVAATPPSQACASTEESTLPADWDPRSMVGQYRVEWVSDTGRQAQTSRFRLFLWKTSMLDSSPKAHSRPAPGDTDLHPVYGVMVPDKGVFTPSRIAQLRAGIDPIYPPVLLLARRSTSSQVPPRDWTVLLLGTVGNRRDDVMILDGAGLGMWVREATADEFKGIFEPWGIIVDDRGHFCARRVPN